MELLLIRHALPLRVSGPAGPADPELSEDGHEQARRLAGYLASERVHAVYSSPLRRAQQTAAAVGESQGVEVHLVDGIAEYDRESSEYIPVEQLKAEGHPMWKEILADEVQAGHGVDAHQFRIGVVAALEEVISRHGGEKVVAVCHGGVINAYLSHILDIEDRPASSTPTTPRSIDSWRLKAASAACSRSMSGAIFAVPVCPPASSPRRDGDFLDVILSLT